MNESFDNKGIEEKIDRYINGQLSPEEIDNLWAELVRDEDRLDYLKSVANLKSVIERRRRNKKKARIWRMWSYAAAAVLVLALGVMLVLNTSTFTGTDSVQPVESIELDYYRSAEGETGRTEDVTVISRAITLANTGEFEQAVSLLEKELEGEIPPSWESEVSLTLGSLFYNESLYREAIPHYEVVIENSDELDVLTLEKAYWYLGNTYFQLEEMEKARENIRKAYELNGAYRRVAQSYLKALAD